MSTYLPNVTDYIPQVQPFQPDLNFYQQALALKQSQYDAGYNQLSRVYGTLLNSPLTHNENVARRDAFFTDIANDIKRISTLDLSKEENVDTAYKVFNPILKDKPFIKDLSFTKAGYSAIERGENMRNCLDEKKCGGRYWDGGIRHIKYQMQDFANSTLQETLSFANPTYTPARNVAKEAMEFAKEMGFVTDNIEWSPDGRYYYKTSNGVTAIPTLTDAFLSTFSNDQGIVDYYKAQGYLQRKDFVTQNADQFGSEEAAEQYYLDNFAKELSTLSAKKVSSLEQSQEFARINKKVLEQYISNVGVDPDNEQDKKIIANYKQSTIDEQVAAAAKNVYNTTYENVAPDTYSGADLFSKRQRIDSAVANGLLVNDLHSAAQSYAMSTFKISDFTADPYKMASFQASLDAALKDKDLENQKELERYKASLEMLKADFEDGGVGVPKAGGPNDGNTPVPGRSSSAANVDVLSEEMTLKNTALSNAINTAKATVDEVTGNLNAIIGGKVGEYININGKSVAVTAEMQKLAKETKNKLLYGLMSPFADEFGGEPVDFNNPTSQTGYKQVISRLQKLTEENPVLRGLMGSDVTSNLEAAQGAIKRNDLTEFAVSTNQKNAAVATIEKLGEKDLDEKDYLFAKYNFIKPNGGIASPEEFAKAYAAAYNQEILRETKNDYDITMYESWGGTSDAQRTATYLMHLRNNTEFYMKEGRDVYDLIYEDFTKVYNKAKGAITQYKEIPVSRQYDPNTKKGGGGLHTMSSIFPNVDVKSNDSEGFSQAQYHMRNAPKAAAIVFNIDPLADEDAIETEIEDENYETNKLRAEQIFNLILSEAGDKDARKKEGRAQFSMETTYLASPVGEDSQYTRAVTFTLNPKFVEANKGGEKTPGVTADVQSITMFFSPSDVDSDPNNPFNINTLGDYGFEARVTGQTSLSVPDAGSIKVTRGNNNNWIINKQVQIFDPNTGTYLTITDEPQETAPNTSENILDQMLLNQKADLKNIQANNRYFQEVYRLDNPNKIIKNPADL